MAVTAAIIAAVATVASAGVGAYTAISSAQQQKAASQYNADVAEQQAMYATQKAAADAAALKDRDRRLLAAQRAQWAAQGLDPSSGSPLELAAETARQADADYRTVLLGGQMAASDLRSRAAMFGMQGDAAMQAGALNAGASVAQGAGGVAGVYQNYSYQQQMQRKYTGE